MLAWRHERLERQVACLAQSIPRCRLRQNTVFADGGWIPFSIIGKRLFSGGKLRESVAKSPGFRPPTIAERRINHLTPNAGNRLRRRWRPATDSVYPRITIAVTGTY